MRGYLRIVPLCLVNLASYACGDDRKVDFAREVQPIFAERCITCHGNDEAKSGLRLTNREGALRTKGDRPAVIIPGKPDESGIIRRVSSSDPEHRMPPKGPPLTSAQVSILRQWIEQGAVWETHWSFQPLSRPQLPPVRDHKWVRNPVDRFVLAKLEALNQTPGPAANRTTLLKRLYYDLLGIAAPPDLVASYLADTAPGAYERLVSRILSSPHFGERWGRHWLDKARYADSDGYEKDRPRPNAWRYRDWVIDSINRDLAFDQFTVQQLAGDLIAGATASERLATAFHRQTLTNTEGGTDQEQFRVEAIFDRVGTTGSIWLGLTIGCAQCHDHKYDPISQREFYQLFAFYNNGDEANTTIAATDAQRAAYVVAKAEHEKKLRNLSRLRRERLGELDGQLGAWEQEVRLQVLQEASDPFRVHPLRDVQVTLAEGSTFKALDDQSILTAGANPDKAEYVLEAQSSADSVTGMRVRLFADESLPKKGPGRAANGNLVLTEIQVLLGEQPVKLKTAESDFAQKGFPAANTIDGKDDTGWAISPQIGKDHQLDVRFDQPIQPGGQTIRVVLKQLHGDKHTLGRFRVELVSGLDPDPSIPEKIRQILLRENDLRTAAEQQAVAAYLAVRDEKYADLHKQVSEHQAKAPKPPTMNIRVIAQRMKDPRETHILTRGDFLRPGEPVQTATLAILHSSSAEPQSDRRGLAEWLTDSDNSLTPRVVVNQIWEKLFGEGLVRTVNDFGVRGENPTHPALLDWLATEWRRLGWSRKELIRLIVTSSTYRQSSAFRPEFATIDPENRLLHRQNRFRVEAEVVRDLFLSASGLLSSKLGGPSVFPPMPPDIAALSYANNFKWKVSGGPDRYRRGLYTFFKRTAPHPNLMTFDCPDSNKTCLKRVSSNTPLQALTLLNNEVFVEAARALAARVFGEIVDDGVHPDAMRLERAFRFCVARAPVELEAKALATLLAECRLWYQDHIDEATELAGGYQVSKVPVHELAAWIATVRIVMNMDEFVTRE